MTYTRCDAQADIFPIANFTEPDTVGLGVAKTAHLLRMFDKSIKYAQEVRLRSRRTAETEAHKKALLAAEAEAHSLKAGRQQKPSASSELRGGLSASSVALFAAVATFVLGFLLESIFYRLRTP